MSQDVEVRSVTSNSYSHSLRADRVSLTLAGPPIRAGATLSILLGDRPIWSVHSGEGARRGPGCCIIDWPPALAGRLSGWARLSVLQDGTPLCPTARVTFDDSPHQFSLEEPGTGMPQIINKWGRIARNFEGRRAYLIDEALDEACRLVEWMRGRGQELFVTGGTLLGPVRDGRVMPGDDDVDLAYLSRHENPSDIALEGFELERALHAEGYETVRHSAGHLQLLFPGADGTDRFYLDIFTYFNVGGWFHGTFHARERTEDVTIFPLRNLSINGRELPAPAEPEQMLAAIYGPGWHTPDPAFRFITPPPARRRYDTWLGGLDWDRENWEDHHRVLLRGQGGHGAGQTPSAWAEELARGLPPGSRILELGCGLGGDARHFSEQGHQVVAVDYSRPAIEHLRAQHAGHGSLEFRRVNLNSLRETAPLARILNEGPGPLYVYARLLLNSLDWQGRENTLGLVRQLLRNQGQAAAAFLEVQVGESEPAFPECRFYAPMNVADLKASLAKLGLEAEEVPPQPGRPADGAIPTQRVKVRALP
ncbi:class I SAM-dependent methyltransferase [Arthrobacter sp. Alg241-R88]|uniref:class I SAM-dependent methyltransferase n=1 Tax=Arthrobacter sp. Alg241-R88 TaxID=2305984 RepID=UPI0019675783|nr:class I SAM-dependent methyltransferase [Arthrobacter sp. Alg241-R88]